MMTRVLIINRQLVFAVTIKQALEQTGTFDVHPFTTLDTALEYLREHPQDIALIDLSLPGIPEDKIIKRLREIQSDIPVIVSPQQPEDKAEILQIQGSINSPFNAREIIPMIGRVLEETGSVPATLATGTNATKPLPHDSELPKTRIFRDEPPTRQLPQTELQPDISEDVPELPGTRQLSQEQEPEFIQTPDEIPELREPHTTPQKRSQTRILSDSDIQAPAKLPEFSSLEDVLSGMRGSDLFDEPEIQDTDTPPVPMARSEALRNFATSSSPEDAGFDNVLHAIDPDDELASEAETDDFDELVNSMRSNEPYKPLPNRQQQFVEFIMRGGMDSLLSEIEKAKTGPLPESEFYAPPASPAPDENSVFQQLAAEEPPMPTLEESGTVGDLMVGVSDSGFHNVLKLLRGGEDQEGESSQDEAMTDDEFKDAFSSFYGAQTPGESLAEDSVSFATSIVTVPSEIYSFDFEEKTDEGIPAQFILETTLDETVPPDSFSIENLLAEIDQRNAAYKPDIQLLPSWRQRPTSEERFIREPAFLPELPRLEEDLSGYDDTTQPSKAQQEIIESDARNLETELLELFDESQPAPVAEAKPDFPSELPEFDEPDEKTLAAEKPAEREEELPAYPIDTSLGDDTQPLPAITDDADAVEIIPEGAVILDTSLDEHIIAQLAVSLTQASLESTAEATLLTRSGEIVAYAGQLASADIEELRTLIPSNQIGGPEEARIRFVTLENSGKGYMLYSCQTDGDYTISMVFADSTPLRDIRRQGKRLVEALQSVPDTIEEEIAEVVEAASEQTLAVALEPPGPLMPYTFLWMVRDPDAHFSEAVGESIVTGLRAQLNAQGWTVARLEASEDYVYLLAGVPGESPTYEVVRDLKQRTAELARRRDPSLDTNNLWSDSYLVMSPGRELDVEEIQQFVNFERML